MVPVVSATLTTRTVRECAHLIGAGWHTTEWRPACSTAGVTHQARERLVVDPVFVPLPEAPDLTCRECGGDGRMVDWTTEQPCDACGGTGVSPVYAATWQWRHIVGVSRTTFDGYEWGIWHRCNKAKPEPRAERRQLVEWVARRVEVLPVVGGDADTDNMPPSFIDCHENGIHILWTDHGTDEEDWRSLDDDEWADNLRPGQFVLRLDGWEHLQQPHTEMACKHGRFSPHYAEVCDDSGRKPLSVPDGVLSWIELA